MSSYLCVWSTHAFSTWVDPWATLISQNRIDTSFVFSLQSSKPQGLPADMCTHFSGLPLCCLPWPLHIWVLVPLSKHFLVIWFTEYPFPNLFTDLSIHHPFSLFQISGSCTSFATPCLLFSENSHFPRSHFWTSVPLSFPKSLKYLLLIPTKNVCKDSPILEAQTTLCQDLVAAAHVPCGSNEVIYWYPPSVKTGFYISELSVV